MVSVRLSLSIGRFADAAGSWREAGGDDTTARDGLVDDNARCSNFSVSRFLHCLNEYCCRRLERPSWQLWLLLYLHMSPNPPDTASIPALVLHNVAPGARCPCGSGGSIRCSSHI